MMRTLSRRSFAVIGTLAACCVVLCPNSSEAQAQGGPVSLVRSSILEQHQAWRVLMLVRLPKRPPEPLLVLRFRLSQTVDFVRSEDPTKPRRVELDPPRDVEPFEKTVDMRDGQGNIGRSARTEITLPRDKGFRAGIWMLRIDGPDGPLGAPISITLEGVNDSAIPPTEG